MPYLNIKIGAAVAVPVNTQAPAISGTPEEGETLTATPGTWTGATTILGQWLVDGAVQSGETGLTFVLPALSDGALITYRETADGSFTADSNALAFVENTSIYAGKVVLFPLKGQSGQVGRGGPIDPVLDATDPDILMLQPGTTPTLTTASDPLPHIGTVIADTIGMGLTFAKQFKALYSPAKIVLVPMAEGSTGFSAGDWWMGNEFSTYETARGRWEFAYNLAVAQYGAANVVVGGILWAQGESETVNFEAQYNTPNLGRHQYSVMPTSMFEAVRRGELVGMDQNTPVLVASMPSGSGLTGSTAYAEVQAGLANIPSQIDKAAFVDVTDLSEVDAVHLDAPSLRTLGERMSVAYADALNRPPIPSYEPPAFVQDAANVETGFALDMTGVPDNSPIIVQEGTSNLFLALGTNVSGQAMQFGNGGDPSYIRMSGEPDGRAPRPDLAARDFVIKGVATSNSSGTQGFFCRWVTGTGTRSFALIKGLSAGRLQFYGSETGSAGELLLDAPAPANGVEFSFEIRRVGTTMTLSIDGVVEDTRTGAYTFRTPNDTIDFFIGEWEGSTLDGSIKNLSLEYLS